MSARNIFSTATSASVTMSMAPFLSMRTPLRKYELDAARLEHGLDGGRKQNRIRRLGADA
jgi:hypothetical protein